MVQECVYLAVYWTHGGQCPQDMGGQWRCPHVAKTVRWPSEGSSGSRPTSSYPWPPWVADRLPQSQGNAPSVGLVPYFPGTQWSVVAGLWRPANKWHISGYAGNNTDTRMIGKRPNGWHMFIIIIILFFCCANSRMADRCAVQNIIIINVLININYIYQFKIN